MAALCRVESVAILADNFVHVIHDGTTAVVVDPGEAAPVLKFLETRDLRCARILLTHHHSDHVDGVDALRARHPCEVWGPSRDPLQPRSGSTRVVCDGDRFEVLGLEAEVMDLAGHTLDHVGYWLAAPKWLFAGDVLFALGCGRIFEGTLEQSYAALQKLKALPDESRVFCAHDYFERNAAFCRAEGHSIDGYQSVLPLRLGQEKAFNPFLAAPNLESFRARRERRNRF